MNVVDILDSIVLVCIWVITLAHGAKLVRLIALLLR